VGTWGTAIFSDDLAADVRDVFTDFVADGLGVPEASNRLAAEFDDALKDEDEASVFWLALAAVQSKLGRLTDDVRDKAAGVIDSGADLRRWQDAGESDIASRKKHLQKLRQQLLGPQSKPKKLRPRKKSSTGLQPGDVAAYRLDEKTSVRFCVLQVWGDRGGSYAETCLLGLEDGTPFTMTSLVLADTLGPHFTMLSREPEDRITVLRRRLAVPERNKETLRAWFRVSVRGWACRWDDFPAALRSVLPKMGWM
jgi:hypothetical protein